MKLWMKILIGLLLGVITGLLVGEHSETLKPVGDLFINLINMVVTLLIFSSMTLGVTSIHDPEKLGRVGLKTLFSYLITTVLAISIGLLVAHVVRPGVGLGLEATVSATEPIVTGEVKPLSQIIFDIIPRNPIGALAEGQVLQVIVFSVFLGLAINFSGEKGKPLLGVIESLADVMYRLTSIIMEFAPYGVFAYMAWVAGSFGADVLKSLVWFLLANYIACALQVAIVFVGLLLFARLNPIRFFRGMSDAIVFALSTSSSSATLPVSMHCVQENLGVSRNISSFVLPLGSTVNMNGTAIFQGITAVFIAQAYGIDLAWDQLLVVIVTATLSAVGAAGIPGTGWLMMSAVLGSAGLPKEGMQLVVGVDRVREMVSTAVNILGDSVVALYIARSEDELDMEVYNHTELVEMEEIEV